MEEFFNYRSDPRYDPRYDRPEAVFETAVQIEALEERGQHDETGKGTELLIFKAKNGKRLGLGEKERAE